MPRVQVYLPEELYRAVKDLGLPISELSQEAVRRELRRRELLQETDRYLAELAEEVEGSPTPEELTAADAWIDEAMSRLPSRRSA